MARAAERRLLLGLVFICVRDLCAWSPMDLVLCPVKKVSIRCRSVFTAASGNRPRHVPFSHTVRRDHHRILSVDSAFPNFAHLRFRCRSSTCNLKLAHQPKLTAAWPITHFLVGRRPSFGPSLLKTYILYYSVFWSPILFLYLSAFHSFHLDLYLCCGYRSSAADSSASQSTRAFVCTALCALHYTPCGLAQVQGSRSRRPRVGSVDHLCMFIISLKKFLFFNHSLSLTNSRLYLGK